MAKIKPIIADPMKLYALGLRNLMDMAILVHIGRCGLLGARRTDLAAALGVAYDTARSGIDRLEEMKLVRIVTRGNSQGRPQSYICTRYGWDLLTEPADFSLFPHAQLAMKLPS